jgi:hypothetical protein|tara:strand:+ start:474 stop:1112 length:639 start_codon:yes stop_codon:yes gene_type:complete
MSIECLNRALKIQGLNPTQKLILVILANYADENNTCYPSYKHLSKMIGLNTVKSVQQAVKHFVELGYIEIEHRTLDNGGFTSNRYHLKLPSVNKNPSTLQDTPHVSTTTTNTKDNTKIKYSENFEWFWKVYPRKVSKKSAYKSFIKIDEKEHSRILYSVELFQKDNLQTEERFIPHATTWLNQERWMDYFETDNQGVIRPKNKNKSLNNLAG